MRALKAREKLKKMGTDVYKSVVKFEEIKMNKLLQEFLKNQTEESSKKFFKKIKITHGTAHQLLKKRCLLAHL